MPSSLTDQWKVCRQKFPTLVVTRETLVVTPKLQQPVYSLWPVYIRVSPGTDIQNDISQCATGKAIGLYVIAILVDPVNSLGEVFEPLFLQLTAHVELPASMHTDLDKAFCVKEIVLLRQWRPEKPYWVIDLAKWVV